MSHHKNTFQANNLVVDYISFKFQSSNQSTKTEVANYLFKFGFNSYQESGKLAKPTRHPIFVDFKNNFEVCFLIENSYWDGTLLHFSGPNAAAFYSLLRQKKIDRTIFSSAILSRFDIHYLRKNKKTKIDKISSSEFLQHCYTKLQKTTKNVKLEKNNKGYILKIGNRKSNHYYRIYQKPNDLKFEYEIKGRALKQLYSLLVDNSFEQFEKKLYFQFIFNFGKVLPLRYSYTDWLTVKLRPIANQKYLPNGFNSDYIMKELDCDPKQLIMFLQFLNYVVKLDANFQTTWVGEELQNPVLCRIVKFKVGDFLSYLNIQNNRYQLNKLRYFFNNIQKGLIQSSSDEYFQSISAIPLLEIIKEKKFLIVQALVVDELFSYQFPFLLPDYFQNNPKKHEFNAKVHMLKIFTTSDIEKIIYVEEFLQNYSSILSNGEKKKIKTIFIQLVRELQQNDLIESECKFLNKGNLYSVDHLTTENISEGFAIYEKISNFNQLED